MRLALEHRRVGLTEHLDVSERKRVILVAKIEIIEPERLLKASRGGLGVREIAISAELWWHM